MKHQEWREISNEASTIDVPPVTYRDHKNNHAIILQFADEPVIANAIAPQRSEFRSLQRLAYLAGVIQRPYPHAQKRRYPLGRRSAYF
jgi:hypothetical protein